jgi:hypothetical protein
MVVVIKLGKLWLQDGTTGGSGRLTGGIGWGVEAGEGGIPKLLRYA